MTEIERRRLLKVLGAAGVTLPVLAACGGDETPADQAPGAEPEPGTEEPPAEETRGEETPTAEAEAPPDGTRLAATGDIPVGGGKVFADQKVIVTQPTEGDFKGFSALCTHARCPLETVTDGIINCSQTCGHGSQFDLEGNVKNGPAAAPLEAAAITVAGDAVILQA